MYSRLYDSMLSWYSQWYPEGRLRHLSTTLAMTVLMAFNISSTLNLLVIGGLDRSIFSFAANKAVFFPLFAALTAFHFAFSAWRSASLKERGDHPSTHVSKTIAGYYMAVSATVLCLSWAALIVLAHP
jgi:hypothetical protein